MKPPIQTATACRTPGRSTGRARALALVVAGLVAALGGAVASGASELLMSATVDGSTAGTGARRFLGDNENTCLAVSAENIVNGPGNWYAYVEISDKPYTFAKGDHLEYDILLPALNPQLRGGVDTDLKREDRPELPAGPPWLRDRGLKDQRGLSSHGDAILEPARDKWYHRSFDLSSLAGCTTARWNVVFEGDQPGRYVQFLDNIRITRDGKTVFPVYENGPAPEIKLGINQGYSREVLITTAPRDGTLSDKAVAEILARAQKGNGIRTARDRFHAEIEVARGLLKAAEAHVPPGQQRTGLSSADLDATASEEDLAAFEARDGDRYLESLRRARAKLAPFQSYVRRFTGHLVGHGHIDLQWLWGWDETVNQIIPETFGQAVKFMQEFPGFTFSQSSAALYLATEQHQAELFKRIQEFEKKGQWEIVGGRWCEGDLNMISPESHVRHFLYAQRYFQQRFGHICTTGFEPDTFGHPWTLPQILRKAGIRSYYFCRGASEPTSSASPRTKDVPLFWWEGPDGSQVLTFHETALGTWYNGNVTDERIERLPKFVEKTGAQDYLVVYGVGNHGGGPTRENLEAALALKDRPLGPTIKFSTLTAFFQKLYEQQDRLTIPTVREELNSVFEGCYTSHSRIKKYNRDSEVLLTSAETFAALAAQSPALVGRGQGEGLGAPANARFSYPRDEFQQLWRDVLWNHHHDTICGSFAHTSSEYSAKMYAALLKHGHELLEQSQQELAARINRYCPKPHLVVFNPLAWTRSEVVEATVAVPVTERLTTFYDADGDVPTQVLDRQLAGDRVILKVCFGARQVPGCGVRIFALRGAAWAKLPGITEETLNEVYPVPAPSRIGQGEVPLQPRFQILHEKPAGMSAWEVGEIDKTADLTGDSADLIENGPVRRRARTVCHYDKSTITQDTFFYPDRATARSDFDTTVEWGQVGNPTYGGDMLKVAFSTGVEAETATYEIPFGDVARKNDGHETVALKWCDLTGTDGAGVSAGERGVTVLNDCKHGYDVKDGVIRLTLLRSSYDPDPAPDVGTHRMRYAVIPHDGPLDKAAAVRAAWEFNNPLQVLVIDSPESAAVPPGAGLPTAWSGCAVEPANIILTCLKRAEDNDDIILRAYECAGKQAAATITLGFDAQAVTETDLLEREVKDTGRASIAGRVITAEFGPYEIRTFRVRR